MIIDLIPFDQSIFGGFSIWDDLFHISFDNDLETNQDFQADLQPRDKHRWLRQILCSMGIQCSLKKLGKKVKIDVLPPKICKLKWISKNVQIGIKKDKYHEHTCSAKSFVNHVGRE